MVIDVDPCDMAKFCDQLITHFRVENDRFSDVPRELDPGAGSVRMLATWPARRGVFPVQFRIGNDQGMVDLDGHISKDATSWPCPVGLVGVNAFRSGIARLTV